MVLGIIELDIINDFLNFVARSRTFNQMFNRCRKKMSIAR